MADVDIRFRAETTQAARAIETVARAQDKLEVSTRRATDQMIRQQKIKGPMAPSAGKPSAPNITPYLPGGGLAEQFKGILGALGITGIGAGLAAIARSIDENNRILLDIAKKQQDTAKKLAPNAFFNKNVFPQEDYSKIRNTISIATATPLEEIDKIINNFSAITDDAVTLEQITKSVALAQKLNIASQEELLKLEQASIGSGKAPGAAIADLVDLVMANDNAAQIKDLVDEIAEFKDTDFAAGIANVLLKQNAATAEKNMQALLEFQKEGSVENIRKRLGIDDSLSGGAFLGKFFEELKNISSDIGISQHDTLDRMVERGDMSPEVSDALSSLIKDPSINESLSYFSNNVNNAADALTAISGIIDEIRRTNQSFNSAWEADQGVIRGQVKESSPESTPANEAFKRQADLTERAIKAGLGPRLIDPETDKVADTLWNRFLIYNKEERGIPFVDNLAEYQEELAVNIEDLGKKIEKGEAGVLDYAKYYMSLGQSYNPMAGGMGLAKKSKEQWDAAPEFLRELFSIDASNIPILGAGVTYGETGRWMPGKYTTQDAEGNLQEEFTTGALGQLGLDAILGGIGGALGKKAGASASKEVIKQADSLVKSVEGAAQIREALIKSAWRKSSAEGMEGVQKQFNELLNKSFDDAILKSVEMDPLINASKKVGEAAAKNVEEINKVVVEKWGVGLSKNELWGAVSGAGVGGTASGTINTIINSRNPQWETPTAQSATKATLNPPSPTTSSLGLVIEGDPVSNTEIRDNLNKYISDPNKVVPPSALKYDDMAVAGSSEEELPPEEYDPWGIREKIGFAGPLSRDESMGIRARLSQKYNWKRQTLTSEQATEVQDRLSEKYNWGGRNKEAPEITREEYIKKQIDLNIELNNKIDKLVESNNAIYLTNKEGNEDRKRIKMTSEEQKERNKQLNTKRYNPNVMR